MTQSLWARLTAGVASLLEAYPQVTDPQDRIQARLLLSYIWYIVGLGALIVGFLLLIGSMRIQDWDTHAILLGILIALVLYEPIRNGHVRMGAGILIATNTLFFVVVPFAPESSPVFLGGAAIAVMLTAMIFSMRSALLLLAGIILSVIGLIVGLHPESISTFRLMLVLVVWLTGMGLVLVRHIRKVAEVGIERLEQANAELVRQDRRLSLALKTGVIGVWEWDRETDVLTWTDEMYAIHEQQKGQFTPTWERWAELIDPEDLEFGRGLVLGARDGSSFSAIKEVDFRITVAGGRVKHIRAALSVVKGAAGEVAGIVGVNIDVTHAREALDATERALLKERALNQMKFDFVTVASHEFRTPLAAISASCQTLERFSDTMSPEARSEKFAQVSGQIRHMITLLDDSLLLQNLEGPQFELRPVAFSLTETLRHMVIELSHSTGRDVVYQTPPDDVQITSDAQIVRHLMAAILNNGDKYSPEGSPLEVTLTRSGEQVLIITRDHGIGIPTEEQDTVFAPFQRASNVGTRPGVGLGLTIAQRAATLLRGRITLSSLPGSGTSVSIQLPIEYQPSVEK